MNLEQQYQKIMNMKTDVASRDILNFLNEIIPMHDSNEQWICLNHILEVYLYREYKNTQDLMYSDYRIHELFRILGERAQTLEEKKEYFKKSLQWNPFDLDTLFTLCESYGENEKFNEMKNQLDEMYFYIFTRQDLARYYRLLGFYYMQIYQPDISACLYNYSNYFSETENANGSLIFLEKAMNKEYAKMEVENVKNSIQKQGIPIGPDEKIINMMEKIIFDQGNIQDVELILMYQDILKELKREA